MTTQSLSKKEWRAFFKKQTDLFLSGHHLVSFNAKWMDSLTTFFKDKKGSWGIFCALAGEPPVNQFANNQNLSRQTGHSKCASNPADSADSAVSTLSTHAPSSNSVVLLYPKIQGQEIQFYESQNFSIHPWGMKEPENGKLIEKKHITGVLVPGLGFNLKGQRLGKGKGFYDRYLKDYEGIKVGACYEFQLVEDEFPMEAWDVKMDSILTENGIKNCREG